MSDSFLLSPQEVEALTGAVRARSQLAWLADHGYPAEVGKDGKVKVLRAAVEARSRGFDSLPGHHPGSEQT